MSKFKAESYMSNTLLINYFGVNITVNLDITHLAVDSDGGLFGYS